MSYKKLYKRYVPYGAVCELISDSFYVTPPQGYTVVYTPGYQDVVPTYNAYISLGYSGFFHPKDECYLEKKP